MTKISNMPQKLNLSNWFSSRFPLCLSVSVSKRFLYIYIYIYIFACPLSLKKKKINGSTSYWTMQDIYGFEGLSDITKWVKILIRFMFCRVGSFGGFFVFSGKRLTGSNPAVFLLYIFFFFSKLQQWE